MYTPSLWWILFPWLVFFTCTTEFSHMNSLNLSLEVRNAVRDSKYERDLMQDKFYVVGFEMEPHGKECRWPLGAESNFGCQPWRTESHNPMSLAKDSELLMRTHLADISILAFWDTELRTSHFVPKLLTYRTKKMNVLFETTKMVGICCITKKKPIFKVKIPIFK